MHAIDLFAGLGGFSEGAKQAGVEVLFAANHWPDAVRVHEANHPEVRHLVQDLHLCDWTTVPQHDVLLASPACQGHARARGRERPGHDTARATAWCVVSAAEVHKPRVIVVENVPEFRSWVLYNTWRSALEALGYSVCEHLLDAADFGVPQNRTRLFLVAVRGRRQLQLRLERREHVPFGPCVDWESSGWSPIDRPGRSAATLARVRAGRARYGDRFLAPFYGSGSGRTGRSLDRPIGSILTRDRWMVVDGPNMRMLSIKEYKRGMGFNDNYNVPDTPKRLGIHLLGNAVCPRVAAEVLRAIQVAC